MWSKLTIHRPEERPILNTSSIRICWLLCCFEGLELSCSDCYALRDLVPLVQFKKT